MTLTSEHIGVVPLRKNAKAFYPEGNPMSNRDTSVSAAFVKIFEKRENQTFSFSKIL
jgi:hypothetical protein